MDGINFRLFSCCRFDKLQITNSIPALRFCSGGGAGWTKYVAGAAVGWIVGSKFHCGRLQKKLNSKHKQDQKNLYTQYYNDVYNLQAEKAELIQALEQMGVKLR